MTSSIQSVQALIDNLPPEDLALLITLAGRVNDATRKYGDIGTLAMVAAHSNFVEELKARPSPTPTEMVVRAALEASQVPA